MNSSERKPRLLFFQWDHRPNAKAANYLLLHMQQQVKCLQTHFDVAVVNHDCDYAEMCDLHQPDLVLFESGYRSHGSRRITVANTRCNAAIPKLALHNGDAWCDRRAGFLSDLDHWGIETCFSIATLAPQYMPELKGRLFVWPNFVDPDIFHDYRQQKVIPVTQTGQVYGLYPWRQQVFPKIRERYPCLVSPQHAYENSHAARLLSGEAYARVLNASHVVPTCGTVAGEVVRKHFEIPGANACLVTERSEAIDAAGFVDMENCVFADQHTILDRLDYLFSHPEEMAQITAAGYRLVHERHTLYCRPQIYQWYMLDRDLGPGEQIIQRDPFGDIVRVRHVSASDMRFPRSPARDRSLIQLADYFLLADRIGKAEKALERCRDYVAYLPEARFRLALCALRCGDAARACELLADLIKTTTVDYGAPDPDPVEWAWFLLALVCDGRLGQARQLQHFYPRLRHGELRRAHLVIGRLTGTAVSPGEGDPSGDRKTIHGLPVRTDVEWLAWYVETLKRCRQPQLSRAILQHRESTSPAATKARLQHHWGTRIFLTADRLLSLLNLDRLRPNIPPLPEFRYFWHLARRAVPARLRGWLRRIRSAAAGSTSGFRRSPQS